MLRLAIGGVVLVATLSFAAGVAAAKKQGNPGYHK